jgi:acetyl esterase/lipase
MRPFLPLLAILVLSPVTPAPALEPERNRPYVDGGTPDQVLDFEAPAGVTGFPAVVFIHGGSLQEGGERRTSPVYARVCEPFLAAGAACATIDYRLAPTHTWPAMPLDAAAAVKWVRARVEALHGDPKRLFVFGHSSGCHLAAILGANPKYLASVGLKPSDLAGVVAMGCTLAPTEEWLAQVTMEQLKERYPKMREAATFGSLDERLDSDPSRFLGPHMPPTLVVLAESERFFPAILEQGAKFARRLLEAKGAADVVVVPGKHLTSIGNLWQKDDPTFAAIRKFMADPAAAGAAAR